MFRQALSLLTYRKRNTVFMTLLLALMFFLIGSIPSLFSAKDILLFHARADIRGIFDGMLFDLSAEQKEGLKAHPDNLRSAGYIEHYGAYEINGESIRIGSFDAAALELGWIDAVEGRLPEAAGEIVLEEFYKRLVPEGIGSTLTLLTENGEQTYTVCGFIEDYTLSWSQGINLNDLVEDLPHALVAPEGAPGAVTRIDALIYMDRIKETEIQIENFGKLARSLGFSYEQYYYNELLYDGVSPTHQKYQTVFLLAILAGIIIAAYITVSFYVESYQELAKTLFTLGAAPKNTLALLITWLALLILISLPVYLALHFVFSAATAAHLDIPIPLSKTWGWIGFIAFGFISLTVWFHQRKVKPLEELSISLQKERTAIAEIRLGRNMNASFAKSRAKRNRGRLWGVYSSIAIILALFLCVQEDINSQLGLSTYHKENLRFILGTNVLREDIDFIRLGDFQPATKELSIPTKTAETFLRMEEVKSITLNYGGLSPRLLLTDKNSAYADALYKATVETLSHPAAPSVPEETWAAGGFSIYVLHQEDLAAFQSAFPEVNIEDDLALGKAILYYQSILQFNEDGTSEVISNDLFHEGGEISFGWLDTRSEFREAIKDPSLFSYQEKSFLITKMFFYDLQADGKAIKNNREFTDFTFEMSDYHPVTVIISEETAYQTDFCSRVDGLSLSLDADITEKQYQAIKTKLEDVIWEAPRMQLVETRVGAGFSKESVRAVVFTRDILVILLSLFLLYSLLTVLHSSFSQYHQIFGVMRAVAIGKAVCSAPYSRSFCSTGFN